MSILLPSISFRSNHLTSKDAVSCRQACYQIVSKFVTTLEVFSITEHIGFCYQVTNFQFFGQAIVGSLYRQNMGKFKLAVCNVWVFPIYKFHNYHTLCRKLNFQNPRNLIAFNRFIAIAFIAFVYKQFNYRASLEVVLQ